MRKFLFIGCLLFCVNATTVSAQEVVISQKRTAVRKLLEVTEGQRLAAAIFNELITRYQENWADDVIKGFKAKGLFKPLSQNETAQMETLIHEFGDNLFSDIKKRVLQQVMTAENLESLNSPAFEKYLSENEINDLVAFSQTQTGKKFVEVCSRLLRQALISDLESKGLFDFLSSPEEEEAKVTRIFGESGGNPFVEVYKTLTVAKILSDGHFNESEISELFAFSKTLIAVKLTKVSPNILAEIHAANTKLYVPLVGKITSEVFAEQMSIFEKQASEILKNVRPRKSAKIPSSN